MYLVSWIEEESRLEASLGGRITVEEMAVFAEEIRESLQIVNASPYRLLLDYSKAKRFDDATSLMLADLKDGCLENGADKIVTIVRDENDVLAHVSSRIQHVMEGREEFLLEQEEIRWPVPAAVAKAKAA